jgi:hypothetical protein
MDIHGEAMIKEKKVRKRQWLKIDDANFTVSSLSFSANKYVVGRLG